MFRDRGRGEQTGSLLRGVTLIVMLALAGCAGGASEEAATASPVPMVPEGRLAGARNWAYQLQNIAIDELAALDVDLIVIDYADNTGRPFSQEEIARLQESGKIVLSYLSIGEAEVYRSYWQPAWGGSTAGDCAAPLSASAPDWLDPVNPEWCGNYPVQYWRSEWQAIIINYLDQILAAGFDGVYLDKVDTFYYWLGEEDLGQSMTNPDSPRQMAEFVGLIAEHARQAKPGFIVMPQNAPSIIEYLDENQRATYWRLIDGIGVEDTFFYPASGAESGENAPYDPQEYVLDLLSQFQAAGVPIFAIDYVTEPEKISRFFEEARARGFVPYAAVRALDRVGTIAER